MSTDTPDLHRHSMRLQDYDYAGAGGYFVTICTHGRTCVFGEVSNSEMRLGEVGRIVDMERRRTSEIRAEVSLDAFVIMPNHVPGIVFIGEKTRRADENVLPRTMRGTDRRSLSSFVSGFKAATTRRATAMRCAAFVPFWQRNYYEHVIRNEPDLDRVRQYVADNPARWSEDGYHPPKVRSGSAG